MAGIAPSTKAMVMLDLQTNPLGMKGGEANLQAPFNATAPAARIFLVNHSASHQRRFVKVAASFKRGAAQVLQADAELRKLYNIATIKEAISEGQDMNVYGQSIRPAVFAPIWNGKRYPVPPAKNATDKPPRVQVPEGLWDLLMGNFQRMHSLDPRERAEEAMRLAISQTNKHSAIMAMTIDGVRTDVDNEFGFIEIERMVEHMTPVDPDSEFLTALELVES